MDHTNRQANKGKERKGKSIMSLLLWYLIFYSLTSNMALERNEVGELSYKYLPTTCQCEIDILEVEIASVDSDIERLQELRKALVS